MARRPRRDARRREEPRPAGKYRLIVLGLAALAVFAVARLPASLVSGRLQPWQVSAEAYAGTIWSGTAAGLAWRGVPIGVLNWSVEPAMLLRGRLAADFQLSRLDGSVAGKASTGFGGGVRLESVQVDLPLAALSGLSPGVSRAWQGQVRGTLEDLRIVAGWPQYVRGTLDVSRLVSPPPASTQFGAYRTVFPDPGPAADGASIVTARITDQGGPLSVDARLTLPADRSFLIEGTVAPRGVVQESLQRSLQFLGPPDASGRRPFSMSGTF